MPPPFLPTIIQDNVPFVAVLQYSKTWRVLSINDDTTSIISLDAYNNITKGKEANNKTRFDEFLTIYHKEKGNHN